MNKLTKLLSVFVLAGAIGTGVAGAVGCNRTPDTPDEPGTHNHETWSTTGTPNSDGTTHKLTCTTDGCTETKNEPHKNKTADNKCGVCGADMGGGSSSEHEVTDVEVTAAATNVLVGGTVQLTATVTPSTATNKAVTWTVNKTDLADIDENGLLTAKAPGTVIVTATSDDNPDKMDTATISITARSKFDELTEHTGNIISKDFGTAETIELFSGTYGTKGVYYYGSEASAPSKGGTYKVDGGVVKSDTKAVASPETKTENICFIVDLGETKDVIEGYVEVIPQAMGNDWSIFQLRGKSALRQDDSEIFSIHTKTSGGDLDYRLNAKPADGGKEYDAKDSITASAGEKLKIYFRVNTATGMLTVKVDDKFICENLLTTITEVNGLAMITSNGGLRDIHVDNLAVATYDAPKQDYKDAIDAYVAMVTVNDKLTLTGSIVDGAVSTIKGQIDAAATITSADVTASIEAIDAAVLAQAKDSACAIVDALRTDTSVETFTGDAATELAEVKSTQKGLINAATSVDDVVEALDTAKTEVGYVRNDKQRESAVITIAIVNDGSTVNDTTAAAAIKSSGDKVTKADLDALWTFTEGATKKVTGYSLTAGGAAIDFGADGYTLTADSDTTLSIYAIVENKTLKTVELHASDFPSDGNGYAATTSGLGDNGFFTAISGGASKSAKQQSDPFGRKESEEDGAAPLKVIAMTGGGATKTQNAIKFTVESECTVTISGLIKKYTSTGTAADRKLRVKEFETDANATLTDLTVDGVTATSLPVMPRITDESTVDDIVTYTFKLAAGTYYIGADGDGMWVFGLSVSYLV